MIIEPPPIRLAITNDTIGGFDSSFCYGAFMGVSDTVTVKESVKVHPVPWRVEYSRRCKDWHTKSCPRVVDADGKLVVEMPQNVDHPGKYDIVADLSAITIVDCVNAISGKERCPECGYTKDDCETHGDHDLCSEFPFFEWEFYA